MTKEEILELVLSSGSNNLGNFGGRFQGGKNLQQIPEEITEIIWTLLEYKTEIKNYAEIGSAGGGTTSLFNEIFNFENVFIVDNNMHDDHKKRPQILKDVKNVREYIGDSQGPEAKKFIESFNIPLDLIFIDADHSYEGVKNDTLNYTDLVKKGGFLLFHDTIVCSGVEKYIKELQEKTDEYKFIINAGTRLGLGLFQKL